MVDGKENVDWEVDGASLAFRCVTPDLADTGVFLLFVSHSIVSVSFISASDFIKQCAR